MFCTLTMCPKYFSFCLRISVAFSCLQPSVSTIHNHTLPLARPQFPSFYFFISRLSDLLFQKHSRDFIVDLAKPNCALIRDARKPNFGSVFKNWNRTEAKRSNPKFRFPWLFSKPNLSHSNSQYLSHSHKTVTFFTLV